MVKFAKLLGIDVAAIERSIGGDQPKKETPIGRTRGGRRIAGESNIAKLKAAAAARDAKQAKTAGRSGRTVDRYRAGKRLWSAQDDALLRALYPDTPSKALAARFRRSISSVYRRAAILGLAKSEAYMASPHACRLRRGDNVGLAYRFKPGQTPPNKGLRRPGWGPGRMKDTQFKKGCATNWMPIGSTRLVDGYVYRKVSDHRNVPWTRNWVAENRLVWEAAHGPLPPGHALRYRNGDRTDNRLENLECITRRELMARNTVHNLPKPLAQTIQLLGALNRKIRRRTRGEEQDRRSA